MTARSPRHPKVICIHVPKCGGSSFGAALRMQFLLSQATITLGQGNPALMGEARILDDYAQRQHQLRRLIGQGKRMIAGHVQYDPLLHKTAARDYRYITLLREPMARLVSHYHYLMQMVAVLLGTTSGSEKLSISTT